MWQGSLPIRRDKSSQGHGDASTGCSCWPAGSLGVGGERRRSRPRWEHAPLSLFRLPLLHRLPHCSDLSTAKCGARQSWRRRQGVRSRGRSSISAEVGPERIFIDGPGGACVNVAQEVLSAAWVKSKDLTRHKHPVKVPHVAGQPYFSNSVLVVLCLDLPAGFSLRKSQDHLK